MPAIILKLHADGRARGTTHKKLRPHLLHATSTRLMIFWARGDGA